MIPVICSQYLFIFSIGLQPVIFTITLFLSSFWLFFYSQKEILKKLLLSHIITAILCCPIYFKILTFGKSAKKFKEISFSSILHYFRELSLFDLMQKYLLVFYSKMSLSFLLLILAWILLTALKKQRPNKKTLLLLSSVFIFPLLFDFIFQVGIHYKMEFHYFIIFSLILIFLFIFICQDLNKHLKYKKNYFYILSAFLVLFFTNAWLQTLKINQSIKFFKFYSGYKVDQIYDYLKKKGCPEDFAIEIRLMPVLAPRFSYIKNQRILFYDPKKHPALINYFKKYTTSPPFFYEEDSFSIYYIDWNKNSHDKNQQVFFITRKDKISVERHENASYQILSQFLPEKLIGNFAIFTLTLSSQNKEEEYIRFLQQVKDKTAKRYQSSLLETLIYYSYKKKKKSEFNKLLQEYREINSYQPEYVKIYKYPSRFDHLRRVKYFERLIWH